MAVLDAVPLAAGAEVTVECNPDTVTAELLASYRAHGVNAAQPRRPVDGPSRAHHARAYPQSGQRGAGRGAGARRRLRDVQPRSHLRRRRRDARRLAPHARPRPCPRSASHQRLRPDGGARDAAGRRPGAPPRRRHASGGVRSRRRGARPGPAWRTTRSRTGPGPVTSAGTTFSIGARATTSGSAAAAHSHRAGRRWWNVRTPDRYIALVGAGESPEAAGETLDDETRELEGLQLALRTREGVPLGTLDTEPLESFVEVRGDRVVLTRAGRLVANDISTRLVASSTRKGV